MSPAEQFAGRVRRIFAVAPGRPNLAAGLRAAIATIVPLVAASLIHLSSGIWLGLAGFSAALADKGGSYRTRAVAMSALTIVMAISAVVGGIAGRNAALAVVLMLAWGVLAGLARVYGAAGLSVATSGPILFAVSLAYPVMSGADAVVRGALVIVGGGWAMLLSLVLWPLRPYRPVSLAAARLWRALAVFASEVARGAAPAASRVQVREALEGARAALAATRRGRLEESARGERLLVLIEGADQMFVLLLALADTFQGVRSTPSISPSPIPAAPAARPALPAADVGAPLDRARRAAATAVARIADFAHGMAGVLERDGRGAPAAAPAWGPEAVRDALADPAAVRAGPVARALWAQGAVLLARLREYGIAALDAASTLESEHPLPAGARPFAAELAEPSGWAERESRSCRAAAAPVRAALTRDSLVLRHALRLGIATAAAVLLARWLGLARGYWVTITVIVVLQPYWGASFEKGMQRVIGTVLGGILAAALAALVHDPRGTMALVFIGAVASVSVLPLNYAIYSMLTTPTFVLLAEVAAGDWHLAGLRIANTAIGGVLALAAARLLWAAPERSRIAELIAAALAGDRDYLRAVVVACGATDGRPLAALGAARRRAGLAHLNAEASFQRLLAEGDGAPARTEPLMTVLTYLRRISATTTALAATATGRASDECPPELDAGVAQLARALDDLTAALAAGRAPAPLAVGALEPAADPLIAAQLERVWRQVTVLHGALGRVIAENGPAPSS